MSKIIVRPISKNELDILPGRENHSLIFTDLDGALIKTIPAPENGWTLDALEQQDITHSELLNSVEGWDAYLKDANEQVWVGSSEI